MGYLVQAISRPLLFFLLCGLGHVWKNGALAVTEVDLSGPACDREFLIRDEDDVISVIHEPRYNTLGTRDHCDVTIRAEDGRRIQYVLERKSFDECGIQILIFDNPTVDVRPLEDITCDDGRNVPIYGLTRYNVLRISVRKVSVEARTYNFQMRMKNDKGPSLQFEKDKGEYLGDALEPGVIAGIGIAGGIVIIALILLAIYLCIQARQSNVKDGASSTRGESSVYTSGRVELEPPSETHKSSLHQEPRDIRKDMGPWKTSEARRPRRKRPMAPTPTQPTPRDPGRRGLSDRHRSGERAARPASQTRGTTRMMREEEITAGRRVRGLR